MKFIIIIIIIIITSSVRSLRILLGALFGTHSICVPCGKGPTAHDRAGDIQQNGPRLSALSMTELDSDI